jgi:hypothetical protein
VAPLERISTSAATIYGAPPGAKTGEMSGSPSGAGGTAVRLHQFARFALPQCNSIERDQRHFISAEWKCILT